MTTFAWITNSTHADNGNIALTGELDLSNTREFTLAMHSGTTNTARSPIWRNPWIPFDDHLYPI